MKMRYISTFSRGSGKCWITAREGGWCQPWGLGLSQHHQGVGDQSEFE